VTAEAVFMVLLVLLVFGKVNKLIK